MSIRFPMARAVGRALSILVMFTFVAAPAAAQTSDLLISEYVEGSSLNKAVELYNGTGSTIDLAAGSYQLEFYFNGSSSAGTIISLTGSVAPDDVYVVASSSAGAAIAAVADQTSGAGFFNGDDAVVLRRGGNAGPVLDSLGQVGFDPGSEWGSGNTSTSDNTLVRKAAACTGDVDPSNAFDPSVDYDGFAQDDFTDLGAHTASCGLVIAPVINEFVVDHTGSDTETYVEIFGSPNTDYSAFSVIEIEGDTTGAGVIDEVVALGTTNATGHFATTLGAFDAENGTITLLLVEGFSGSAGTDLDTDNDGTFDVALPWTSLVDGVATSDGGASDFVYSTVDLAPNFDGDSFQPGGASRLPDGTDTDTVSDWTRNDFNGAGLPALDPGTPDVGEALNTPGAPNQLVGGPSTANRLLLTEIVVTPTGGEFVEIFNPNGFPVDLSDVYLTDATFAGGGVFYYNVVTGTDAGGGGFGDFHARFPDGAQIGAGEFQTVAIAGSEGFFAEYGVEPDYELFEDGIAADPVPDMREALTGSVNGQGGLTNGGEVVILYFWDGASDLVTDLDYVVWGDKVEAVDKTSIAVDGPDADLLATTYQPDTAIGAQEVVFPGAHLGGQSFTRLDFDEGTETSTGGNGVGGADETSENLSVTWAVAAPTPGDVLPSGLVINEVDYDQPGSDAAEFIEIFNAGASAVSLDGLALQLINGSSASIYDTIDLPAAILGAGEFFVVCGDAANTPNCDLDTTPDTNLIQNGSPDAIALVQGTTIIDVISYEGSVAAPYVEGTGTSAADDSSSDFLGLSRIPDGADSDSNDADFSLRCITPGETNSNETSSCPDPAIAPPAPILVINEVNADPDGSLAGDANNDGTRDGSDDEFVEIVNNTGSDVDISGWTLADAVGVRHTFPAGTVLTDGCGIVVFGGGSPAGGFGGMVVQTASSGFLGFNNGGDAVTLNDGTTDQASVSYGSEGGANQSLTRDPDITGAEPLVQHTSATGAGGALFSPGTRVDGSIFAGCTFVPPAPVTAEIFEIQGNGLASPLIGQLVTTESNIVTAVGPDLFVIQTPDARADADPDTSNGIIVFTGSAPAVSVGDLVDVSGTVVEFFDLTEINSVTDVTVVSSGNPLPAVVALDATTPSPNAPQDPLEFERIEGMRVSIASGIVCSGNQGFGSDPIAEVHVTAGADRCLREPGIEFPGLPGLPVWDGNPEVFELDEDALGLPATLIPGGSTFSAEGVIAYEFGDYEIWPTGVSITPAALPVPVRARAAGEFTIGSLNLFRLFDDVDDPAVDGRDDFVATTAEYDRRRIKIARHVVEVLDSPDVLGVQEIESLAVLQDLAGEIALLNPGVTYTAHLIEGNDVGTIDVGFLTRANISVDAVTQLGAAETLTFDGSLLHDRPPLLLEGAFTGNGAPFEFAVMVNHLRSLNGIDDASSGPRVRQKRLEQAQSIAEKVQDFQTANPSVPLTVLGDLNAFEFTDGYVDVVGQIIGDIDPADALLSGPDLVDPNLANQVLSLPTSQRYSFNFRGNAQALDHALTSTAADAFIRGFEFGRGNADAAEELIEDDSTALRASDHDGFALFVMSDADGDGVPDDADNCPATANADQADADGDGIGDACDSCNAAIGPVYENVTQTDTELTGEVFDCSGIQSVALEAGSVNLEFALNRGIVVDTRVAFTVALTDIFQPGSGVVTADGASVTGATLNVALPGLSDGDGDGVPDGEDNCPATANPDQTDTDGDGIGDACDSCDATIGPAFELVNQTQTRIVAEVFDCAGIQSLGLGGAAQNLVFNVLAGVPGDPTWSFEVQLADPARPGSGEVLADGALVTGASFAVDFGSGAVPVPALDPRGLVLLMLAMLLAGMVFVRQR